MDSVPGQHETWTLAVSRFCRQTLRLNDGAIARLLECADEGKDSTFLFRTKAVETHCFGHKLVVEGGCDLVYDALRLKFTLTEKDKTHFGPILERNFCTVEEGVQLDGFDGTESGAIGSGSIIREWAWLARAEAEVACAIGLMPPESAPLFKSVMLTRETKNVSALLIGIESSAPMKDDAFGQKHTADAKSKATSAFGKRKWCDYGNGGQDVPAKKGGMRVTINEIQFQHVMEACRILDLCTPSAGHVPGKQQEAEKELFQSVLQDSAEEAGKILEAQLMEIRTLRDRTALGRGGTKLTM